jgi:transcriptional regulator with XRE-family HTH domain
MRGLGQNMTIGQRVAWYRARRGLTQEVLAGMVGRTTDWLGKIENGRANLERLSVIKSLADALDVTVGDLLGEPSVMDWTPDASTRTVTLLREALMSYPALALPVAATTPPTVNELRGQVEEVWSAYQASRFAFATTQLPKVIAGAKAAVRNGDTSDSRREAQRMLALAYHAASATLSKVGEADLAWIAADRGLTCAEDSEDAMVLGSLLRSVTHALLANGRYDDAASMASRAADRLDAESLPDNALRWSLVGSLHLVGAMAAARADDAREARAFLARARQAGQQLGHDGNHAWTAFGPTNVAVHDLSVAMELGDLQAASALAPRIDARALPVERRVRHALEVAKVYAMTGRDDEGLAVVLHAERDAPEQVKYHYLARELVMLWLRRTRLGEPSWMPLRSVSAWPDALQSLV